MAERGADGGKTAELGRARARALERLPKRAEIGWGRLGAILRLIPPVATIYRKGAHTERERCDDLRRRCAARPRHAYSPSTSSTDPVRFQSSKPSASQGRLSAWARWPLARGPYEHARPITICVC